MGSRERRAPPLTAAVNHAASSPACPASSAASRDASNETSTTLDRESVIQIAGDLIDAEGIEALTLTAIAKEAGVTQPALYRHIESLNDLWRGLGLMNREQLALELTTASVGRAGRDAVLSVANAWRAYGLAHPGRYRADERYAVVGDAELEAAVERVLDILALSLRSFNMSDDDLVHGARTLRSALHGFVSFEIGDGHPHSQDTDDSFDHLVEMLCAGFEASGRANVQSTDSSSSGK